MLRISVYLLLMSFAHWQFVHAYDRPNIIFILADDFGYNDIGYHAQDHLSDLKTPHLDRLAAEGIKLENYYVQPICSPTRSQLMSGRYQIHTGLQHRVIMPAQPNALPYDEKILPEQLKACGYDTHMVGKWHLGFYEEKFLPFNRGFNSYYGYLTAQEDYYTHVSCGGWKIPCGIDMYSSVEGPTNSSQGEYSTNLFTRKAIQAIDNRDKSKPLFLYLAYQAVHGPVEVPQKYMEPFEHIKDKTRRTYAGMVLAMDEAIYNLTNHLEASGMMNNTIIVFSTDNGGQTNEGGNNWPLRGRKDTLWEGGVKGVGFVYGKSLDIKSVTHRGLLHVSDWLPTLLGASRCPKINGTKPLDGFNQWGAILQKSPAPRSEILHNIDPKEKVIRFQNKSLPFDIRVKSAIRSGPWKLLTGNPGFDKWVKPPESQQSSEEINSSDFISMSNLVYLFNIDEDPYEHKNVASSNPEVVIDLLMRLAKYESTAVPVRYPLPDIRSDPIFHGGFWVPWIKH